MAAKEKSIFQYMNHKQAIMCLTFIGGFMDSAGYVMLYELFTASITGNIVGATLPLWRDEPGFAARAVVVLSIGLGAGLVTAYSMKLRFTTTMNKWEIGLRLFSCELVALLVAMIVGLCLNYPEIDSGSVFMQSALMAFSMGVQNGAAMVLIPNCPPTTAMTGNTVRFYIYGAEALGFWLAAHNYIDLYPEETGRPEGYDEKMRKQARELALKFRIFLASLGPFTVGAVLGAGFAFHMGMSCLVFPLCVVGWVLFCIWKGLQAHRAEKEAGKGLGAGKSDKGQGPEAEPEVTLSPLYATVATAETGQSDGVPGVSPAAVEEGQGHDPYASSTTGTSSSRLRPVNSYQLIEDDAYLAGQEEVTSEQLHRLD